MTRTLQLELTCVVFLLSVSAARCIADQPAPPRPFIEPSANGHFEFVMIDGSDGQEGEIKRRGYPATGVYACSNSKQPLWTVHLNAFPGEVFVANNGVNLVWTRSGTWSLSFATKVLFFYENGRLIRSYSVKDLFSMPESLSQTVINIKWLDEGSSLNDSASTFILKTKDGKTHYFDFRTGAKVAPRLQSVLSKTWSGSSFPYVKALSNGTHVFVMVSGIARERLRDQGAIRPLEMEEHSVQVLGSASSLEADLLNLVKQDNLRSGMYLRNKPTEPIWTIDEYIFPRDLFLATNGSHMIRTSFVHAQHYALGHHESVQLPKFERPAVSFFESGKEIRSYDSDMLKQIFPIILKGEARRQCTAGGGFGRADGSFFLSSHAARIWFDYRTGQIIDLDEVQKRMPPVPTDNYAFAVGKTVLLITLAIYAVVITGWLVFFRKKRTRTDGSPPTSLATDANS